MQDQDRPPTPLPSEPPPSAPPVPSKMTWLERASDGARRALNRFLSNPRWFVRRAGSPVFLLTLERGALLFGAALFLTGLVATLATALALFRVAAPILIGVWALAALGVGVAAARKRIAVVGDRYDAAGLAIALLLGASSLFLYHHYFAAHADIGFYISDALATATTGSRSLHGPYDGLLPGFTQGGNGYRLSGMFGYSSLAALFTYAAGAYATPWVNGPLALVTAVAIFCVARRLQSQTGALLGLAFYASSLLTIWLSRWVMTENGAIATFWVGALLALQLASRWDSLRAWALAIALVYGALIRPEGSLVAVWFVLVLLVIHQRSIIAALRSRMGAAPRWLARPRVWAPAVVVAALAATTLPALYRALPHDYLRGSFNVARQLLAGRAAADSPDVPTVGPGPNWGDYALRYEWDSAVAYFLPWFFVVGVLGIALRLMAWRRALLLIVLALPYIIFLLMPPVTTAHPWFMRRLWVAFIPLLYILAGASLDARTAAMRWPLRLPKGLYPRVLPGAAAVIVALVLFIANVAIAAPVALKREQDAVQPMGPVLLKALPPGATVIIDEDVLEYSAVLRFYHDGYVVPWFNRRVESFFASLDAADRTAPNNTYVLRIPWATRYFMETDQKGQSEQHWFNTTLSNTARRDFRTYLASPPFELGYQPLQQYLDADVPPNNWRTANKTFQLVRAVEPVVLTKNIRFIAEEWQRTPAGMVAQRSPSNLVINTTKFRAEVVQNFSLGLHFVYRQTTNGTIPVMGYGASAPLGFLPSDGSGTLRNGTVNLARPLSLALYQNHWVVQFPQGTVLRGALLDLSA